MVPFTMGQAFKHMSRVPLLVKQPHTAYFLEWAQSDEHNKAKITMYIKQNFNNNNKQHSCEIYPFDLKLPTKFVT